eukprot:TRINITY_DN10654_c1_g1_i2.p1 TRINITY_DN10654_c1_g1~~TRINITY_DN10654_c1_g1_i2.p1  ORF type:complete len:547 (+),score=69.35 TRINITY_DN10654_c1_g1_i2:81-1721(+)
MQYTRVRGLWSARFTISTPCRGGARRLWSPALASSMCSYRLSPCRVGMRLQHRGYVDSADRTIAVRSMEDPVEVLAFMSQHSDCDTRTHETALRVLGRLASGANYEQLVQDGRFHSLLSALASRLEDCDARTLSMIADSSSKFRSSTPELTDLAQRLAEVVTRREDSLTSRELSTIAMSLAMRGVRDETTVEYIRTESLKIMSEFEPGHCSMLLEAFRRWGVFDRQLTDLAVERLCDEIDRFTGRDIVATLGVASRLGLARGFLLRRLCTSAFDNLRQFTPLQLVRMSYSLAKLRFLSPSMIDDVIDALQSDVDRLLVTQISELLFSIAMADAQQQTSLVRSLVAQYAAKPNDHKSFTSLADFSWSLFALGIADEFQVELKDALTSAFERKPPQNRVPLMKLFDVLCALELEGASIDVQVPKEWRAACDDADRYEMDRLESSRLHNEIIMRLDNLRGAANGTRWQLRVQRNQQAGPYRVDMLDETTKVAIDIEIVSMPTSRRLKHRLLERIGYKPICINYWAWRRARSEEDQNLFLEREITRVLER